MKKLITITFLILFFIPMISAQSHISFMGMAVDGNFKEFKKGLEKKGFIYDDSIKSMYKFQGQFAYKPVELIVLATPKTNIVYKVIVYFPIQGTWSKLKSHYFYLKDLYQEKYPLDANFEFFQPPYFEGDGYEMQAVELEKCKYASFFLAVGGGIMIEIQKSKQISVTYEDRDNIKKAKDEIKKSALDDI